MNWKYRLPETEMFQTQITPSELLETDFITLNTDGVLTLSAGYAWDGASGPALDTPSFMRASAVHDALYQLMKIGLLDIDRWFKPSNKEMIIWAKKDGMPWIRQKWCYAAVQTFGKKYMNRNNDDMKIFVAGER